MFGFFKSKPVEKPKYTGPTISLEGVEYEDRLMSELRTRMDRMWDWAHRLDESHVKRAFIECCREMADELENEDVQAKSVPNK